MNNYKDNNINDDSKMLDILRSNPFLANQIIEADVFDFNTIKFGTDYIISGPAICALNLNTWDSTRKINLKNLFNLYNKPSYNDTSDDIKNNNIKTIIENLNFNELLKLVSSSNFIANDYNIDLLINKLKKVFNFDTINTIEDPYERYLIIEDYHVSLSILVDVLLHKAKNRKEYRYNLLAVSNLLNKSGLLEIDDNEKSIKNNRKQFTYLIKQYRDNK